MKNKNTLKPIDIIFGIFAFLSILIFVIHYSSFFVNAESPSSPMPYKPDSSPIYASFDYDSYLTKANYINNILPAIKRDAGESYFNATWPTYVLTVNDFGPDWESYMLCQYYNFNDSFFSGTSDVTFGGRCFQFIVFSNGTFQLNGNPNFNASRTYSQVFGNDGISQGKHIGYPLYYVGNFNGLTFDVPNPPFVPNTGHATQPDTNGNNVTSNGQANQPNTPSFPVFPTINIDLTNVESILQSIFNLVESFADYVGECFSTFFSWLVSVIQNGFQSVINNIKNLITYLYQNFVSLFEPISANIEYLVQPISSSVIYENISSTSLVSNISTIETSLNSFSNSFNSLSEPQSYTIPIHLENLPSSMFGTLSTQYIDLSIINSVKSIIRAFIWAMVTYGLFITIVDSISNYINGGQDE